MCRRIVLIDDFADDIGAAYAQILSKHKSHRHAAYCSACKRGNEHKTVIAVRIVLRTLYGAEHVDKTRIEYDRDCRVDCKFSFKHAKCRNDERNIE